MYIIPEENFGYMGLRIKNRRKEKGYTQEQLAESIHVSLTHIARIEKGAHPSVEILASLAKELELSVDELLDLDYGDNPVITALVQRLAGRSSAEQQMALDLVEEMMVGLDRIKKSQ